jgi:hypothetical protein
MRKIHYYVHGIRSELGRYHESRLGGYAIPRGETVDEAVSRSVARRAGLVVLAARIESWTATQVTIGITLGRRCGAVVLRCLATTREP